jgi:hypothetical protein
MYLVQGITIMPMNLVPTLERSLLVGEERKLAIVLLDQVIIVMKELNF